jgi:hypothetical protein
MAIPQGDVSHASNFRSACAACSRSKYTAEAKRMAGLGLVSCKLIEQRHLAKPAACLIQFEGWTNKYER